MCSEISNNVDVSSSINKNCLIQKLFIILFNYLSFLIFNPL